MKTYGDSTKTPAGHLDDRCYILAQFPESSNLDWARDLRSILGGGELKYKSFLSLRHRVQSNRQLWGRIQSGTSEASIVVIENAFYIEAIMYRLQNEGADIGHDIDFEEMLRLAALCMIDHTPIMRLRDMTEDLLHGPTARFARYDPESVLEKIGHKFNDAVIFAARANASFDIDALDRAASTNELFLSPHRPRLTSELDQIERIFDNEHPKSAALLNEMMVAASPSNCTSTKVSESDSSSIDALQAADFAAGFACEIMMNELNDRERALRRHFRKVIYNGACR
jgi:hypothetical protein